jgi:hypothetical protein
MLKQLVMSSAIATVAFVGTASAQELPSRGEPAQAPAWIPASIDGGDAEAAAIFSAAGRTLGLTAQLRDAVPDFKANFDLAGQTVRPAPLAPGSAEIP